MRVSTLSPTSRVLALRSNSRRSHAISRSGQGSTARSRSLQVLEVQIHKIHFATTRTGSRDFHYLYRNSDRYEPPEEHPDKESLKAAMDERERNLQGWGRGGKIAEPEWTAEGNEDVGQNLPACFTRKKPISMSVKLVAQTDVSFTGRLSLKAEIDGKSADGKQASVKFTYPANATGHWVNISTVERMPEEIGRYNVMLYWGVGVHDRVSHFVGPVKTSHTIYVIYGRPLRPDYDSAELSDPGKKTTRREGTLTGTPKRLDHLCRLIGGESMNHPVACEADLDALYWQLYKGVNNAEKAVPPYFDDWNNEHITAGRRNKGPRLPLEDQWLAWVPTEYRWNGVSCIGQVQLAKTMLAAVGLHARRAWVVPHTTVLPAKDSRGRSIRYSLQDGDLYCLGTHEWSRRQYWIFDHNGKEYAATPVIVRRPNTFDYFEACLLTPGGKLLPGGVDTEKLPKQIKECRGFSKATELLRWWCDLERKNFGRAFICWGYHNEEEGGKQIHFWDVNGEHYLWKKASEEQEDSPPSRKDEPDYIRIRDNGKDLPPP